MKLFPQELKVLQLLLDGMDNPTIAKTLGITDNTVKRHLTNIFDKTGYSTRLELAVNVLQKRFAKQLEELRITHEDEMRRILDCVRMYGIGAEQRPRT